MNALLRKIMKLLVDWQWIFKNFDDFQIARWTLVCFELCVQNTQFALKFFLIRTNLIKFICIKLINKDKL